jgi:hypothetical protein
MNDTAGANMEDARGETRVIAEIKPRRSHFLLRGKLSGICGSSWDSQPIRPKDKSVSGTSSRSSCPFFERFDRRVAMRETRDLVLLGVGARSSVEFCWCPDLVEVWVC